MSTKKKQFQILNVDYICRNEFVKYRNALYKDQNFLKVVKSLVDENSTSLMLTQGDVRTHLLKVSRDSHHDVKKSYLLNASYVVLTFGGHL